MEGGGLFQSSGKREWGEGEGGSLLGVILHDPQPQEQAWGGVL